MRRAFFLDRDGVINEDYGYVGRLDRFDLLPGVPAALRRLKQQGFLTILVTNQSGIARGFFSADDFMTLTAAMQRRLSAEGADFDGIYYCPHHPAADVPAYRRDCPCRKPRPGMLEQAAADYGIDLSCSCLVGDHASDLKAGLAAGVGRLYLVGRHLEQEGARVPEAVRYPDLAALVKEEFKDVR